MLQVDQHAALMDFWQWESQSRVEVVADMATDEKDYLMPLDMLRDYLEANDSQKLCQILLEVFESDDFPIHPELILRGHTAIFCILLRIGKGKYIEHFARYEELSDQRLPFDPNQPPPYFPMAIEDKDFLQQFCEKQWVYCVPMFDSHMLHKHFGRQRLLPIMQKEKRGGNGSATIFKIQIFAPHNRLTAVGSGMQENNLSNNTFILKRYTKEFENQYMHEIKAFRSLKHPDSILRFCGSYIHGDDYNILLECADKGSLEDYFHRETPPSRGVDIIRFWEGLFKLLEALKAIHSVLGSHQDIKPANVLVLSYGVESPSEWKFKLADFGLSQAKRKVLQGSDAMADESRGALTYSAPECYMPYNLHDTQAADIWSLGCIYSEAAVWIADGYKGLVDYRRHRMAGIDKILNFRGRDCFHDGDRVLEAVLDAHIGIEESLRRSDYITKDVLDSMVDEMLWEEDRPKAKALLRKAEGVLSRARQKLPSSTGEDFSRPAGSNSRSTPLPRYQPPQQPLPEIPRGLPTGLSSIAERQYLPNVEKWRSQVTVSQISGAQFSGHASDLSSPVYTQGERFGPESISDLDQELSGSIASWRINDNSSLASQITPFTSPHPSVHYDYHRHFLTGGRPRPLQSQSQRSSEYKRPKIIRSRISDTASENGSTPLSEAEPPVESEDPIIPMAPPNGQWTPRSLVDDSRTLIDDSRTVGQTSRHSSSAYSNSVLDPIVRNESLSYPLSSGDLQIPPKSQKRSGFSLFPPSNPKSSPLISNFFNTPSKTSIHRDIPPVSRPETAQSMAPLTVPTLPESPSIDYLSLNTALEWKRAHKKVKKKEKVPPLPGAHLLDELKERDHVFIIDDAASMNVCRTDVKRVFEALSYIVKGMSPEGTELFYTISYDTWRRKDTSDLCEYLEKTSVDGETDIKYRLNLQLQSYKAKILSTKVAKRKKNKHRPVSFYILTNGDWAAGADLKATIKDMSDFLVSPGVELKNCQVTIHLISFAQNAAALQRMNDLTKEDFGLDIVDCTPWTGNVLRMLRGPLDRRPKQREDGEKRERINGLGAPRLGTGAPLAAMWGGELA